MSLNKIMIIGRLTKDPEVKQVGEHTVCRFSVAVDRPYKGDDGKNIVDYFDVDAWRKLGEVCAANLVKGRLVCVEGNHYSRTWKTEDDRTNKAWTVNAIDVQFLDKKPEGVGTVPAAAEGSSDDVPF